MHFEPIKEWQDTQCHWVSNSVVECNDRDDIVKIELCQAVGENAHPPAGAVNQTPHLGTKSKFHFRHESIQGHRSQR